MLAGLGRTAARVGIGLAAGAVGTAAITLSQTIEMKLTGREASTAPVDTLDKVADLAPESKKGQQRMSTVAHWGYGTGLGALRGLLAGTPLSAKAANLLFFTGVSTAPMAYLPALGVAPPPTEWGAKQIVTDTAHHLVYAAAVAGAWRLLTKSRPIRSGKGIFAGW